MAFKQSGSLLAQGAPVLKKAIIANSATSTLLDSVKAASGFVAAGTAGALVLGHVTGHVQNDVGLNTTGAAGAAMGSYVGAYTVASDNQTVGKVKAEVDVSKYTLYSVVPDVAIATTTGSNLLGYKTDIASATATDEDTATTSTAQYNIWGVDPAVAANQIVSIYESQIFGV